MFSAIASAVMMPRSRYVLPIAVSCLGLSWESGACDLDRAARKSAEALSRIRPLVG